MVNFVTGLYVLSTILFFLLLIKCFRVKNGLGLKMIQASVGSAFSVCISMAMIRIAIACNIINSEQALCFSVVPALIMISFSLYLNWLFANKN